jgi:hypothetical protein
MIEPMMMLANVQDFAQQVDLIANLCRNGKLTSETAFEMIALRWSMLNERRDSLLGRASDVHDSIP